MKARAGSKALIREINEAFILDVVRASGPVARGSIAAQTGLSAATVTGITGRLLAAGLVIETDTVRDTGGRPARMLELGHDAVLAAGIRISAGEAHAVLVSLRGEVLAEHRETYAKTDPGVVAAAAAKAVLALMRRHSRSTLLGVGVAISGVVDQAGGLVRHSGSMGWEDVPFRSLLEAELGMAVVIDSYVNSFAVGLLLFDGKPDGQNLLVFSASVSLGVSVVVDGRIHRGFNGAAGGFAHTHVGDRVGPQRPCHCGALDCLETRSSLWGIRRELERLGTGDDALDASSNAGVIADAGTHLGIAMANASKLFGPERVVLVVAPDLDVPALMAGSEQAFRTQYIHENSPVPAFEPMVTAPATFARGAACAVLAGLFTAESADASTSEGVG